MNKNRIIYFTNGSLGDFLLVLYFSKLAHSAGVPAFTIVTPRNAGMFRQLSVNYPYVTVRECNAKSPRGLVNTAVLVAANFWKSNTVITPATPGKVPANIKRLAKFLSSGKWSRLVGFDDGAAINGEIYDDLLTFDERRLYSENLILLADRLGLSVNGEMRRPALSFRADEKVFDDLGLTKGRYVVIHPCGSSAKRSWTVDEAAALAESALGSSDNSASRVVFTGSVADRPVADEATRIINSKGGSRAVSAAGRISILELAALIAGAQLYVGVDTGVTHLAAMMGVSGICVAHEASTYYWLPYYDPNMRVIYSVRNCFHGIHEGEEHLLACYDERNNFLEKVSLTDIRLS